jgi:hypothetical protein
MSKHIVDDEQRSDRRPTPMRPLGSGLEGASASLALLDDVHRHRLRRAALYLPLPSQERGPFQFSDRLLGMSDIDRPQIVIVQKSHPRKPSAGNSHSPRMPYLGSLPVPQLPDIKCPEDTVIARDQTALIWKSGVVRQRFYTLTTCPFLGEHYRPAILNP